MSTAMVYSTAAHSSPVCETDAKGNYAFANLPAGVYPIFEALDRTGFKPRPSPTPFASMGRPRCSSDQRLAISTWRLLPDLSICGLKGLKRIVQKPRSELGVAGRTVSPMERQWPA